MLVANLAKVIVAATTTASGSATTRTLVANMTRSRPILSHQVALGTFNLSTFACISLGMSPVGHEHLKLNTVWDVAIFFNDAFQLPVMKLQACDTLARPSAIGDHVFLLATAPTSHMTKQFPLVGAKFDGRTYIPPLWKAFVADLFQVLVFSQDQWRNSLISARPSKGPL